MLRSKPGNEFLHFAYVVLIVLSWLPITPGAYGQESKNAQKPADRVLRVLPTDDFEVTGDGGAPAWKKAEWEPLHLRTKDGNPYETRFKVLYSKTGLYVLMDATDQRITATMTEDFSDLWKEDVFEVFLWTDEKHPVYFEYEISPLNVELPILIPNYGGKFLGWRPWHSTGSSGPIRSTSAACTPRKRPPRRGSRLVLSPISAFPCANATLRLPLR